MYGKQQYMHLQLRCLRSHVFLASQVDRSGICPWRLSANERPTYITSESLPYDHNTTNIKNEGWRPSGRRLQEAANALGSPPHPLFVATCAAQCLIAAKVA